MTPLDILTIIGLVIVFACLGTLEVLLYLDRRARLRLMKDRLDELISELEKTWKELP